MQQQQQSIQQLQKRKEKQKQNKPNNNNNVHNDLMMDGKKKQKIRHTNKHSIRIEAELCWGAGVWFREFQLSISLVSSSVEPPMSLLVTLWAAMYMW